MMENTPGEVHSPTTPYMIWALLLRNLVAVRNFLSSFSSGKVCRVACGQVVRMDCPHGPSGPLSKYNNHAWPVLSSMDANGVWSNSIIFMFVKYMWLCCGFDLYLGVGDSLVSSLGDCRISRIIAALFAAG